MVRLYTSHMTGFVSLLADNLVLGNMVLVLSAVGPCWRLSAARRSLPFW